MGYRGPFITAFWDLVYNIPAGGFARKTQMRVPSRIVLPCSTTTSTLVSIFFCVNEFADACVWITSIHKTNNCLSCLQLETCLHQIGLRSRMWVRNIPRPQLLLGEVNSWRIAGSKCNATVLSGTSCCHSIVMTGGSRQV